MNKIKLGIIGTGFSAHLHLNALRPLRESSVEVVAVSGRNENKLDSFAKEYHIPEKFSNWKEMIASSAIDVIDICSPTSLHGEMIKSTAECGKDIICEKPLSGFFCDCSSYSENNHTPITKEDAFSRVKQEIHVIRESIDRNKVNFLYAENWIYSPTFQKMIRLLEVGKGKILDIRAEESHSGSHAVYAKRWRDSGGGSLLRLGAHPISGALYLKYLEGMAKNNRPVRAESVISQVGYNYKIPEIALNKASYLHKDWEDVEDWAVTIIDFDDNSKAIITASDCVLGGVINEMRVYTSNSVIYIDMSHNTSVTAYTPSEKAFEDEYITEKIETKTGWMHPSPDEDWMRGYPQEMAHFMECIQTGQNADIDWFLAEETMKVVYGSYASAESHKRIYLG